MAKTFDSLWKYFKRGLAYELLALVLGFIAGLLIAGLLTQPTPVIILGFIIAIPIAFVLVGWAVTLVVKKIN